MNCVDELEATAFCASLGGSLPSEAQWEWAARRGDKKQAFPWTEDVENWKCERANIGLGPWQLGCACERSSGTTCEVGSRALGATPDGVHDLLGNVWELVATDDGHVRRGGGYDSWFGSEASHPTLSERMTTSDAYMDTTGFRCVRPPT